MREENPDNRAHTGGTMRSGQEWEFPSVGLASPEAVGREHIRGEFDRYFSGEALIGEDFTPGEMAEWFADEKEACFELRGAMKEYPYRAKNWFYGFRRLSRRRFNHVLSFGGGNGAELIPIADRAKQITILDASSKFKPLINANYVTPSVNGTIPLQDDTFDLITCFGVLHHIPKVSAAIRELYRCTTIGGVVLLAEPIISMGDWTKPRTGLTKRERGIPWQLLRSFIKDAGFTIVSGNLCNFGPINLLARRFDLQPYNSPLLVLLDHLVCKLPVWSTKYHAIRALEKIRPTAVFYTLRK